MEIFQFMLGELWNELYLIASAAAFKDHLSF